MSNHEELQFGFKKEEATVSNLKEDVIYSPYGQQKATLIKHLIRLQRQEGLGQIYYLSGDLSPEAYPELTIEQDETDCCCVSSSKVDHDAWRSNDEFIGHIRAQEEDKWAYFSWAHSVLCSLGQGKTGGDTYGHRDDPILFNCTFVLDPAHLFVPCTDLNDPMELSRGRGYVRSLAFHHGVNIILVWWDFEQLNPFQTKSEPLFRLELIKKPSDDDVLDLRRDQQGQQHEETIKQL